MASGHRNRRTFLAFEQISHVSAAFSRDKPLDTYLSACRFHSPGLCNGRQTDFARRLFLPAVFAIAIVIVILWIFLAALRP
jgi:hypothetical protein